MATTQLPWELLLQNTHVMWFKPVGNDFSAVCPFRNSQDTSQGQRLQWGEGWEDQRSNSEVPGGHSPQILGSASQPLSKSLLLSWQVDVVQPSTSGFITAVELGHHRKRVVKISTGSKQLDSILGGWAYYPWRCTEADTAVEASKPWVLAKWDLPFMIYSLNLILLS